MVLPQTKYMLIPHHANPQTQIGFKKSTDCAFISLVEVKQIKKLTFPGTGPVGAAYWPGSLSVTCDFQHLHEILDEDKKAIAHYLCITICF